MTDLCGKSLTGQHKWTKWEERELNKGWWMANQRVMVRLCLQCEKAESFVRGVRDYAVRKEETKGGN